MIVPKRRTSRSRKNKRRSHHALAPPSAAPCPECGAPRQPHRACAACGQYKGRRVVIKRERNKDEEGE